MVYNEEEIIELIFREMKNKMKEEGIKSVEQFIEIYNIGYTREGLYKLLKNKRIPDIHVLLRFCDAFDCELEWLLNTEQTCKHYKNQTICDAIWPLSEESANILRHLTIDDVEILDDLISHSQFEYLLAEINHFIKYSRNEELFSHDIGSKEFENIDLDNNSLKSIKKYIVTDAFSKILDDLYDLHNDIEFEVEKLKDEYFDLIKYCIEKKEDTDYIAFLTKNFQSKLRKLSPYDPLCAHNHTYIIKHIEELSK